MRKLIFIVLILISLTMFFLFVVAWKKRRSSGLAAFYLSLCFLGVSIYNFGYALELINDTLVGKMVWVRLQHFGIFAIIPSWLIFSLYNTGRERYVTKARIAALFVIPLIVLISSQTLGTLNWLHNNPHLEMNNGFPNFAYDRGIVTYLYVAYICFCLIISTFLYTIMLIRAAPGFRWQAGIFWVSSLIPWVAGIIYNLGYVSTNLDITPFSFSISGILLGLGFLQFHLLDILPLARDVVFEGMYDGVLVMDPENRVVDLNPSFVTMLPGIQKNYFGKPVEEVLALYPELIEKIDSDPTGAVETNVSIDNSNFYYRSVISPLYKGQKMLVGKILMLHDVTQTKILMQELEELAQLDGLTGVFNRQHFFKLAKAEMYRLERYGGALSLIMLDMDHFKKINDTFGHAAGDQALKMVINTMQPLLRKSDLIGRFGGEEFLILCPQTEPQQCLSIIDRFRRAIESENFLVDGHSVSLTASFGVTGVTPPFQSTLEELVSLADKATYEAKNLGGNQICIQLPPSGR